MTSLKPSERERKRLTKTGRHSATRTLGTRNQKVLSLHQKDQVSLPEALNVPQVVMRCVNSKCGARLAVSKDVWFGGESYTCQFCGSKMLYHKDAGEK